MINLARLKGLVATTLSVVATTAHLAYGIEKHPPSSNIALAQSPQACVMALTESRHLSQPEDSLLPNRLALLSWNIYKAKRSGLLQDLATLSLDRDILLLQEAVTDKRVTDIKPFWRFSPGYKTQKQSSGVMSLSRWPARVHCQFSHKEPWLRTPKATNIVSYGLTNGKHLLVVNIHAINFTFGLKAYRKQLQDIALIISQHQGPVVVAGDFNTWNDSRQQLLSTVFSNVLLAEAAFTVDNRSKVLGRALDGIWVRELTISASSVPLYTSSDHNPLLMTIHSSNPTERLYAARR